MYSAQSAIDVFRPSPAATQPVRGSAYSSTRPAYLSFCCRVLTVRLRPALAGAYLFRGGKAARPVSVLPVYALLVGVKVHRFGDSRSAQCLQHDGLLPGRHRPFAAPPLEEGRAREAAEQYLHERCVLFGIHPFLHARESAGIAHRGAAAVVAAGVILAALRRVDDTEAVARRQQFLVGYLSQTVARQGAVGMQAGCIRIRYGGMRAYCHDMAKFFVCAANVRFLAQSSKLFPLLLPPHDASVRSKLQAVVVRKRKKIRIFVLYTF